MADGLRLDVDVRGLREVQRALDRLPAQALRETKDGSERLARGMANRIRAAGRARGRQAARPSRTVRVLRSVFPRVVAGPHPLLFGTEFGAHRRFGWYAKSRYRGSILRQFPTHRGNRGYWFFPTYEADRPRVRAAHQDMADAIIRAWSA